MLTLNPRQLRVLSHVAPGTLLLTNDSMAATTFLTTEDDRARSNIWAITLDQDGNVKLSTEQGPDIEWDYETVMRNRREQMEEAVHFWDDAIRALAG